MHDRAVWKLSLVAAFLISTPAVFAQSPAAQQAPASNAQATVLHLTSNLVLVDVVVTDKGKAVLDLDRTKFHLFEDGKEQAISAFDEHQPAAAAVALPTPPALPPHTYNNTPIHAETGVFNVLLLDGLNTPATDQMRVRQQMIEYMGKIQPGTMMAVFTLSTRMGLRMATGFTTDPAQLTKTVKDQKTDIPTLLAGPTAPDPLDSLQSYFDGMGGGPAVSSMRAFEGDIASQILEERVRMTLDAMKQLGLYLSAIPGRKNLIWFTGSFPAAIDPQGSAASPLQDMPAYSEDVRKTDELLMAARVAVYPVDARGLMTLLPYGASSGSQNPSGDSAAFTVQLDAEHGAMREIAEQTGGQAYINTNGLKEAVARAVENGNSYYTLAYTPASKKFDGQFHRIQVSVDAQGWGDQLAYRRGYYADSPEKPAMKSFKGLSPFLASTMHGAPPATQVLLQARVLPASDPLFAGVKLDDDPGGEMTASLKGQAHRTIVDLTIDAHTLAFNTTPAELHQASFECTLVAYDANGKRLNYVDGMIPVDLKANQYAQILSTGIPLRLAIDLPAGQYFLRIAVHDKNADHVGALEVPVMVAAK
jgi:VWFA-related protein